MIVSQLSYFPLELNYQAIKVLPTATSCYVPSEIIVSKPKIDSVLRKNVGWKVRTLFSVRNASSNWPQEYMLSVVMRIGVRALRIVVLLVLQSKMIEHCEASIMTHRPPMF